MYARFVSQALRRLRFSGHHRVRLAATRTEGGADLRPSALPPLRYANSAERRLLPCARPHGQRAAGEGRCGVNPPKRVWVYWCRECGRPIVAEKIRDVDVNCPSCPFPHDSNVACDRYELSRPEKDGGK